MGDVFDFTVRLIKISSLLCLQGYVCPGILVTLSDAADVRVVQEAWSAHALATPPGYRIYRLGLSGGCSVTPFPQVRKQRPKFYSIMFVVKNQGTATIRATQHIINASYNQRQRFFHLSPEPRMLLLQ
jgi:hypothetical protein